MGFLAGLAGALLASRLNTAVVLAGQGVELKVITAVVLGGASLSGGVGTIFGAFLGVLFMALLQNAMIIAGISPFWQLIVVGIVLLVSVGPRPVRARAQRRRPDATCGEAQCEQTEGKKQDEDLAERHARSRASALRSRPPARPSPRARRA